MTICVILVQHVQDCTIPLSQNAEKWVFWLLLAFLVKINVFKVSNPKMTSKLPKIGYNLRIYKHSMPFSRIFFQMEAEK